MRDLAEQGVRHVNLNAGTFFEDAHEVDTELFDCAIEWCREEGLIRVYSGLPDTEERHLLHYDCVLTAKGFALLGQRFGVDGTVGKAVKEVSDGHGYANAGELIGGILGAFTKSISG